MTTRVRAIALDAFGTTIMRAQKLIDPYAGLFADCGRDITASARHRLLTEPFDFNDTIDIFRLGGPHRAQLEQKAEERFKRDAAQCHRADGLDALLVAAHDMGLKTIVISNLGLRYGAVVENLLDDIPHKILSYDVGLIKPDARIFHMAAECLGVDPAVMVMVGDKIKNDVMGAHDAGYADAFLIQDNFGLSDVIPTLKKNRLLP